MNGRIVAVVALAVLAGCGAFAGGGSTPEPIDSVTPLPVTQTAETATSEPLGVDLPPGISRSGNLTVERLLSAHWNATAGRSYVWVYRQRNGPRPFDQPTKEFRRRVAAGPNGTHVRDGISVATVSGQDTELPRSSFMPGIAGNSTRFSPNASRARRLAPTASLVRRFVHNQTFDIDTVQRGGQPYIRLQRTLGTGYPTLSGWRQIRDYAVTLYVTPQGFIRSAIVNIKARNTEDAVADVTVRFNYRAVDATTVTPTKNGSPDGTASDRTTTAPDRTTTPTTNTTAD